MIFLSSLLVVLMMSISTVGVMGEGRGGAINFKSRVWWRNVYLIRQNKKYNKEFK